MNHLTDKELINHILIHDTDPVRVRLAGIMERMPGAIIDDLENAGMDNVFCTFRSEINGAEYLPGQYINHLENEIEYLNRELMETQEKLAALKTRTVLDFMTEIGQTVQTLEVKLANAEHDAKDAKSKLSMWSKLNADPGQLI
jgi:predicted RNase H-like nuclease (RuvC/YqgF family)